MFRCTFHAIIIRRNHKYLVPVESLPAIVYKLYVLAKTSCCYDFEYMYEMDYIGRQQVQVFHMNLFAAIHPMDRIFYVKELLDYLGLETRLYQFNSSSHTCRYRSLIERVLRARLVYGSPNMNRAVSFEYMNRQLVWNEFSVTSLSLIA